MKRTDRLLTLMRKATTAATTTHNIGGNPKKRERARPVTLPTLATARAITERKE